MEHNTMRNIFYKAAKATEVLRLETPKLIVNLQKKGFINLIGIKRGKRTAYHATATTRKGITKVKTFASKKALKLYQLADQIKTAAAKAKKFTLAFLKASQLEANVISAKKAISSLKGLLLTSTERFTYYVGLQRAYLAENRFKASLPQYIRVNLF